MPETLPERTHRLFGHYDRLERLAEDFPGLVICRLLEEGDAEDLSWLSRKYSETELASWFDRSGSRQLSRRSRSFWSVVLAGVSPPQKTPGESLWPL